MQYLGRRGCVCLVSLKQLDCSSYALSPQQWSKLYRGHGGGEEPPLLPLMHDGHIWAADFFCLCWTFKLSAVKQINLFLPACVSLIFLSSAFCLLFLFMTPSPLFQCLCWLSHVLSPPPLVSLPYEGQDQGSPITRRRLRKLYGLCPLGCHVALSSGRLQVRSSHWLPAQHPQPQLQHRAI